ncbi:MAG TPA: FAD-binding oxidoreductase [Acidimicrobiales bacterium]
MERAHPTESHAPQPGGPGAPAVTVVGGGIVGLSAALRLAEMGADVTLLERGTLGGGATGATFAWLNASNKEPLAYHLLNVAGMAEYALLRRQFGAAPWLHLDGHLEWAVTDREAAWLAAKAARLHGWGYPAVWLAPDEVARLEPEIRVDGEVDRVLASPTEGWIDTVALVGAMARRATAAGATIRTGVAVVDLLADGGRVHTVVTAGGERLPTSAVVVCTGAAAPELAGALGVTVPMTNTVGLLTFSSPVPVDVRATVTIGRVNVRPDGGGRYCVTALDLDATVDAATPSSPAPPAAGEALARAAEVVPGLGAAAVGSAAVSVRPIPADGLPVVGQLPGTENAYLAVAHSGLTLGPLLGRLVARELLLGERDDRLDGFRPARLTAGPGEPERVGTGA